MLGPAFFDIPAGMLQNIGLQERDTPAVLDAIELQNKHRMGSFFFQLLTRHD